MMKTRRKCSLRILPKVPVTSSPASNYLLPLPLLGYRYGRSLIPITEDDEAQMKVTSDRCLSVLGFSPQSCVCLHQTMGSSVQVVVPMPHDEVRYDQPFHYCPLSPSLYPQCAGRAMSGLIHALYETGTVGVARYVWRQNAAPRLVALLPQIKASHEVRGMQ